MDPSRMLAVAGGALLVFLFCPPGAQTFKGGHLFFFIRERDRFVDAVAKFVGQA
jgi:hypothetical protein